MKQRQLNSTDIVQTNETQNRFGESTEISPLSITRNCGLIKDHKSLTDVKELFIEFDGLNEVNDIGKGTFKRIDNQLLSEDTGVILKINKHYYKRQYTGKVLLDWFNSDTIDTLLLIVKKYQHVKLSNRKYTFNITRSYNVEVTENFYIDGNQAEIEIISEEKLPYIFRLMFNAPTEYALFNNCKLTFNANTFVTALRAVNCQVFDFYTENIFVGMEAHQISLTDGKILDGLPANIQAQKTFTSIPEKTNHTGSADNTELLCVKDLGDLAFVNNYVFATNRTTQNVEGQKTFGEEAGISLPLATEPTQYCNMQNLNAIVYTEMETQLRAYTLARAKEIGLEVSGNFLEGSVYIQIPNLNTGQFIDAEAPEALFGSEDGIPWTNLSEYLLKQFNVDGVQQYFYLRKNKTRTNDGLYIGKANTAKYATGQSVNVMPNNLQSPTFDLTTKPNFILWYKGDCTKLSINIETPDTETPDTETPDTETPDTETPDTETPDTETPDTETPDTETPDTETPDTETPDTETPDTETLTYCDLVTATGDNIPTHTPGTNPFVLSVSMLLDDLNYFGDEITEDTIEVHIDTLANLVSPSSINTSSTTADFEYDIIEGSKVVITFMHYIDSILSNDTTTQFLLAEKRIIIFSMPSNPVTIRPEFTE